MITRTNDALQYLVSKRSRGRTGCRPEGDFVKWIGATKAPENEAMVELRTGSFYATEGSIPSVERG